MTEEQLEAVLAPLDAARLVAGTAEEGRVALAEAARSVLDPGD